jgi:hypothetical protein
MPWFDRPILYDPPWPRKLQVFGMPSMAIGMSSPFDMELAINGRLTQVQPGRAKDSSRRCQPPVSIHRCAGGEQVGYP